MDWETLYGPHRHCRDDGKPCAQGYGVKNGPSRGQPRAWGQACAGRVVLRDGPASDGLEAEPALFETALRATARSVPVDKDTVWAWRHRVACHGRSVLRYGWPARHVSACQRAALWRGVPSKAAHLPGAQRYGDTSGDAWVWSALAPVGRLGRACVIGHRAQAGADGRRTRVAHGTDDFMPLGTSEPWPAYRHAWLPTYGAW
jgi:hypothetical protein